MTPIKLGVFCCLFLSSLFSAYAQNDFKVIYERSQGVLSDEVAGIFNIDMPNDPNVRSRRVRSTLIRSDHVVRFSEDSLVVFQWPEDYYYTDVADLWYHDLTHQETFRFKDYKEPSNAVVTPFSDHRVFKKDKAKWVLLDGESEVILGFNCRHAQLVEKGGLVKFDVWYAPDIPVGVGPYEDLLGLPGLVLKCIRYPKAAAVEVVAVDISLDESVDSLRIPDHKVIAELRETNGNSSGDAMSGLYSGLIRFGRERAGQGWIPFSFPRP